MWSDLSHITRWTQTILISHAFIEHNLLTHTQSGGRIELLLQQKHNPQWDKEEPMSKKSLEQQKDTLVESSTSYLFTLSTFLYCIIYNGCAQ